MNLAVCIPTRGRPLALIGVVMSLWRLRHRNDLIFLIGTDEDDEDSRSAVAQLGKEVPIGLVAGPRSILGAVNNRLSGAAKEAGADVVVDCTDRTFPITYQWDAAIRYTVDRFPHRVSWWSSPQSSATELPIIPKPFLQACEWEWSSEIYPFWFDDIALGEIDVMVHGREIIKAPAAYAGERGKTQRARDIAFWWGVYSKMRQERWRKAESIAAFFGKQIQPRDELDNIWAARDAESIKNASQMESAFGDISDPDATYLAAKKRAEEIIRDL